MKNQSTAPKFLVRQYGAPLFKVTFDVWGPGKNAHVNPEAHVKMTYYGEDFKHCKGKMNSETDGAFYKVAEVVDLNPEYSLAYNEYVSKLEKAPKKEAS